MRVFEVEEHKEVGIPLDQLVSEGEFHLDPRIRERGYFGVSISKGRLVLKTTRFIGLIPLTPNAAVRVIPRSSISNLSDMIVIAGNLPRLVQGFSRHYMPLLTSANETTEIYYLSLLAAVEKLIEHGIMKTYNSNGPNTSWRGRVLFSETVKRYRSKGQKHVIAAEQHSLSFSNIENQVLKKALQKTEAWLAGENGQQARENLVRTRKCLAAFDFVDESRLSTRKMIALTPKRAKNLPSHLQYYGPPLWASYAILQGGVPNLLGEGFLTLDSMIVDVSAVFEGFLRSTLEAHAASLNVKVEDGNQEKYKRRFFQDNPKFKVQPDIVLSRDNKVLAVLDAKYKPDVKERDRYEMLAFLEATACPTSAFICPAVGPIQSSSYLGETLSGKKMNILRYDMGTNKLAEEQKKFVAEVARLIA